ncbi:MAG: glycosyltransferase [Ignavibacteriaceae bacterium]
MGVFNNLKICFIVDANSIHSRRWIEQLVGKENEIFVISTEYCEKKIIGTHHYNIAKDGKRNIKIDSIGSKTNNELNVLTRKINFVLNFKHKIRNYLGSLIETSDLLHFLFLYIKILSKKNKIKKIVHSIGPDILHGMRLPIEGYLAGLSNFTPLALSTFGNDMVFFAKKSLIFKYLTTKAFKNTSLYFCDGMRDKYIAECYGYNPNKITYLTPVIGGLKISDDANDNICIDKRNLYKRKLGLPIDKFIFLNVRGFNFFYIKSEILLHAIPVVIKIFPNTLFILKGNFKSQGYHDLKKISNELNLMDNVIFIERLSADVLEEYFKACDYMVSPTKYDGNPVSMFEAMQFGLIPIMSNHSPIQDWIKHDYNGYLFDYNSPTDLADSLIESIKKHNRNDEIRQINLELVKTRLNYDVKKKEIEYLYKFVIEQNNFKKFNGLDWNSTII